MSRLVLLIALGLLGYILYHYVRAKAKKEGRQAYWKAGLVALAVVLLLLAATGRLHVLVAIGGAILAMVARIAPLMRYWPLFRQLYQRYGNAGASMPPGGQQSQVRTPWLLMTLAHDTGEMDGEVLAGSLQGRKLSSLNQTEFGELCSACREHDGEALRLLAAWVSRAHPDWAGSAETGGNNANNGTGGGEMNAQEAREILGIDTSASRDEIVAAHRRLMSRMHPDKGGSNYLASKINQAKEVLLREQA